MHHYRTNMEEIDRDKYDHHHPQDHHQPPPLPAANGNHQSPPSQPPRKCPRCDSSNTKFCYYNNYSLSQPRYFCKACRRYWTQGGTLRNIPVGGVCRKGGKRHRRSASASSRDDTGGTRSSPSEFRSSRNPTTMIAPDSAIRVPPSIGNSFYSGGGFLSSLAAGQSAPSNQAAAVAFGGVNGENMALLQRINFSSMAARQFQARNEFFTSQQSLNSNPPGGLNSYLSQGFLNGDPATSFSAAGQGSWSAAAAAENQAGSNSFSPAQWPDHKYQGFPPQ